MPLFTIQSPALTNQVILSFFTGRANSVGSRSRVRDCDRSATNLQDRGATFCAAAVGSHQQADWPTVLSNRIYLDECGDVSAVDPDSGDCGADVTAGADGVRLDRPPPPALLV